MGYARFAAPLQHPTSSNCDGVAQSHRNGRVSSLSSRNWTRKSEVGPKALTWHRHCSLDHAGFSRSTPSSQHCWRSRHGATQVSATCYPCPGSTYWQQTNEVREDDSHLSQFLARRCCKARGESELFAQVWARLDRARMQQQHNVFARRSEGPAAGSSVQSPAAPAPRLLDSRETVLGR